jgi:hypothetical protein
MWVQVWIRPKLARNIDMYKKLGMVGVGAQAQVRVWTQTDVEFSV